jgi:hypothetical protein
VKKLSLVIALVFSCVDDHAYDHLHMEGYQLIHCKPEGYKALCVADNQLFMCVESGAGCAPEVACEPMYEHR